MSDRYRRRLIAVIAGGLAVRLIVALATHGLNFDLQTFVLVGQALDHHPLHVYSLVNTTHVYRWPYPSGYFPVVWLLGQVSPSGLRHLIRMPPILADATIAWLVQEYLGWHGASERQRLGAAAAVAFGPLFIEISAYNGHFDSFAILPAVAALMVWERAQPGRRAVAAGVLLGVGGALKTVPLLMVLALLPTARSRREAATLVSWACGLAFLTLLPWLIRDRHSLLMVLLNYRSLAGQGGISLLIQPNLSGIWLGGPYHLLTGLSTALQGHLGTAITLVAIAGAALILLRARAPALDGAIVIWLTVFAFGINYSPRYGVWLLPFLLMAGRIRSSLLIQGLLAVPTALLFAAPFANHDVRFVYVPLMLLAWAGFTAAALLLGLRLVRSRPGRVATAYRGGL